MTLSRLPQAWLAAAIVLTPGLQARSQQAPPPNATYLTADGAVRIIGTDSMRVMLDAADAIFLKTHPAFRFHLELKSGYVALPGLTHGTTAFAPMARDVTAVEMAPYRALNAHEPLIVRVAHGTVTSQTRTAPLGIYVNRANPLKQITLEQLSRIFSSGDPKGDISLWGQLGLTGDWADLPIHTVGTPEDSGFGSFMVADVMGGRPFVPGFAQLLSSVAIVKRLGGDVGAIGFSAVAFETPETRMIPIVRATGEPPMHGTAEEVESGTYGLDRFVFIFARQPVEPWIKEYVRVLLSAEVQQAIAREPHGFLPLNAREVQQELDKLK